MRLLVTGAGGFVGRIAMARAAAGRLPPGWTALAPPPGFDLRDAAAVERLVAEAAPDAVLHLGAMSSVAQSWRDPAAAFAVNALGTATLAAAMARRPRPGRLLLVASADVYGAVADHELPIAETLEPRPASPYAASKLAAEVAAQQWRRSHGLEVVVARAFNHVGPGQAAKFVLPSLAAQAAALAAGRIAAARTGDLEVTRDFCDAEEVVDAYFGLLERGTPGEIYNVCSGVEQRVGDLFARLCALAGTEPRAEVDPALLRPSDQRRLVGDPGRLRALLGRHPAPADDALLARVLAAAQAADA